jgi:hypothetical protein
MLAMDRFSFLITPEYRSFLIGAGFILLALASVFFGAVPGRGRCTYRDKEPKSFWLGVAIYFLTGTLFWVRFWYRTV